MSDEPPRTNCLGCSTGLSISEGEMILVNGQLTEIKGLDEIMEEVRKLKLQKRKDIADGLLERTQARNPVPEGSERQYRDALMDEYDRRYLTVM